MGMLAGGDQALESGSSVILIEGLWEDGGLGAGGLRSA